MTYGYHSDRSLPATDPVQVRDSAVHITLPSRDPREPLAWQLPLHATRCCTTCSSPTILYVGAPVPEKLLAFEHLISQPWERGFWRCLPHPHGFVLIAPAHPYTVHVNGYLHGTCDCADTRPGFSTELPAERPRSPAQPVRRAGAGAAGVTGLVVLDQGPPAPRPFAPMEPAEPFQPAHQLALF